MLDMLPAVEQRGRVIVAVLAIGFMLLEYALARLGHRDVHDGAETTASLAIAFGQHAVRALEAGIVAVPFVLLWRHRLFDFDPRSPLAIAALFLAVEFAYYWQHRAAHRVRWMWATHAVHHSPTRLNLTSGVRLGWTSTVSGNFLFFLPLAWIGFHPFAILAMLGLNLIYQFFIHTELAPRLGPLEWILNTPAHHRVHHASNEACLDRNYGGVLIVFDRLFGTFAEPPRTEPLRYGLVGVAPTSNPLAIVFGGWVAIGHDIATARTWRGRLRALFAPPGTPVEPAASPVSPDPSTQNIPGHEPGPSKEISR